MTENAQAKPADKRRGKNPFVCVDSETFRDGNVKTLVYMNVWQKMGLVRFRIEQSREYTHQRRTGTALSFGPNDWDDMIRGIWKAKAWMKTRQRRSRMSDLFAWFGY